MLSGDEVTGLWTSFLGEWIIHLPWIFGGFCFVFCYLCVGLHESSWMLFSLHTIIGNSVTTDCQKSESPAPWTDAKIPEMISDWTATCQYCYYSGIDGNSGVVTDPVCTPPVCQRTYT